jgi:hypothetical protein
MKGRKPSAETHMIREGESGSTFFTKKSNKDLTSIASYYNRNISCEKLTVIKTGGEVPVSEYILRVTLLDFKK